MDEDASEFLTRKVFPAIKEELIRLEIIEEDTELLGHTFYVATQGCSTFQLIFLDQRIASVVQSKLEEYGFYLRKELLCTNTHLHSTILTAQEICRLKRSDKKNIMKNYQNKVIQVSIKGLVVMYT